MNPLLKLKGTFSHSKAPGVPGPPSLSSKDAVSSGHLANLSGQLSRIALTWNEVNDNPVISVYFKKTIAKTRRPKQLFSADKKKPDAYIVGAKFWGPSNDWHQIIYCVKIDVLESFAASLLKCAEIVANHFDGLMTADKLKSVNFGSNKKAFSKIIESHGLKRTPFSQLIADASQISHIGVDRNAPEHYGEAFVTLYKTDLSANDLLDMLNIPYSPTKIYNDHNLMLSEREYDVLRERAPYLIAMSCEDEVECDVLPKEDQELFARDAPTIAAPGNEPTIGVIDTLFYKDTSRVYFADWVEFHDLTSDDEPSDENSYLHGVCIDSIIVDGPALNPGFDDGCGRFKVKHFGITRSSKIHLFRLARQIREIVKNNRNIKVWNISLGSDTPIGDSSISPLAAILDELQLECNVIFVVAGSNDRNEEGRAGEGCDYKKIGTPADSVNALVVNSVKQDGRPASYTRIGPVLGFFTKPDVSYYGGDIMEPMMTWGMGSYVYQKGTSFAVPWVSRKLSYLIDVKGFSCEAAKALLVDAASGWNPDATSWRTKGHGVLPIRIESILGCEDDEIKFVVSGRTELYQTYNYKLPIPVNNGKFPYSVRATLCYFPHCSKAQGVDYTDTELDFRFGRLRNGTVQPVNNDLQNDLKSYITEAEARSQFRKWDNVKIISESIKNRKIPKKMYDSSLWGIDITSKKRLESKDREDIRFSIVVTLKEMNGKNRIDAFTKACRANNWMVEPILPEIDYDVLAVLEEDVEFDE